MIKGRFEVVRLGGVTIGRATYEPGWRWSQHVGPTVGAARCLDLTRFNGHLTRPRLRAEVFDESSEELIVKARWETRDDARRAIFRDIETWYNRERRHSTLGYPRTGTLRRRRRRARQRWGQYLGMVGRPGDDGACRRREGDPGLEKRRHSVTRAGSTIGTERLRMSSGPRSGVPSTRSRCSAGQRRRPTSAGHRHTRVRQERCVPHPRRYSRAVALGSP
jgi:hypothetical protein